VIEAAADSVRLEASAKNIHLELDLAPSSVIEGDANRLQQVFWNLLLDAIHFSPSGSQVRVVLRHIRSQLDVLIADTGGGIPSDFLPHIFEKFRQGDSPVAQRHEGLGLGLAVVRHLVELHGGQVGVESPGHEGGTTFRLTFGPSAARAQETDVACAS
jgi:signal transduction histidine kinase